MYFTKHSDEEVQTKAIIGLGKLSLNFFKDWNKFLNIVSIKC